MTFVWAVSHVYATHFADYCSQNFASKNVTGICDIMESLAQWIDRAKAATKTKTDSNIGRKFGVSRQTVHKWKQGVAVPSADLMRTMAERADLDVEEALIIRAYWASKDETREVFGRIFHKLAGCFLGTLGASLALSGNFNKPLNNNENSTVVSYEGHPHNLHYVVLE